MHTCTLNASVRLGTLSLQIGAATISELSWIWVKRRRKKKKKIWQPLWARGCAPVPLLYKQGRGEITNNQATTATVISTRDLTPKFQTCLLKWQHVTCWRKTVDDWVSYPGPQIIDTLGWRPTRATNPKHQLLQYLLHGLRDSGNIASRSWQQRQQQAMEGCVHSVKFCEQGEDDTDSGRVTRSWLGGRGWQDFQSKEGKKGIVVH